MSSNVHRLNDYLNDSNDNYSNANSGPTTQPFSTNEPGSRTGESYTPQQPRSQMLFMNPQEGNPSSPYPVLNKVFAPNFSKNTFIFWISIIQIIVFILELIVGQVFEDGAFVASNSMAGPSAVTLKIMGGKYLKCIQQGEVYRFVSPALLHSGILHIFTNLVSQTMIGYTCEFTWGTWKTFGFYFGTAIGASLLSCVGSPCSVSVGASGALLGIIGAYMAWIILNWNNSVVLPQPGQRMCMMVWWLFIIFIIGLSVTGIDNWAHFGGWLSGLLLGFSFCQYSQSVECLQGRMNYCRIFCVVLTIIYMTSLLFSSFFGVSTALCAPCW